MSEYHQNREGYSTVHHDDIISAQVDSDVISTSGPVSK
jgi:hypothetical protein